MKLLIVSHSCLMDEYLFSHEINNHCDGIHDRLEFRFSIRTCEQMNIHMDARMFKLNIRSMTGGSKQ